MSTKLIELVSSLRPSLIMQGRDIAILEETENRIQVQLSGFCGGCGCSAEYVDGLKEMLTQEFPAREIDVVAA